MKNTFRKILWAFIALVLVQAACISPIKPVPTPSTNPSPAATPTKQAAPPAGVYPPAFATYSEAAVSLPQTFKGGGYTLPLDLSQVQGMSDFELTDAQVALLAKNGFVVSTPVAGQYREFYQIYDKTRYSQIPPFITTDSIYHVYHLIFDKMLRDLETDFFINDIKSLTTTMLAATTAQYQSLKGTTLEDPALRNAAYFAVADRLLGLSDPMPAEANDLMNAELALINAAGGPSISPIWDRPDLSDEMKLIEVYDQYIPRGH